MKILLAFLQRQCAGCTGTGLTDQRFDIQTESARHHFGNRDRHQAFSIWCELNPQTRKAEQRLPGGCIPYHRAPIGAARREVRPIWAEAQSENSARVTSQGERLHSRLNVP